MTSSFHRMIGLTSLVLLLLLVASCSGDSAPAEPAEDAAGAEADTDTSLAARPSSSAGRRFRTLKRRRR